MDAKKQTPFVDNNASVQPGARIDGVFTKKLATAMVVGFTFDGKRCSGVLHVSQFPSENRAERDKMFEVARVGMPAPGLTVIEVQPPEGDRRFTSVRLTSRTTGKDMKMERKNAPSTSDRRDSGKHEPEGGQGRHGECKPAAAATSVPASAASTAVSVPVAVAPAAVVAPVVPQGPADPLARARALVAEVRQPARSFGLADLKRAYAVKNLASDAEASALLASIETSIGEIDALGAEARRIASSLDAETLGKATTLYGIRVQKQELDARTAALKQESARYAGLCGKVKRAGDNVPAHLQAQADEMKAAIETRRAALKDACAANKTADDDADLALLFSVKGSDVKAACDEALAIAGNHADTIKKRDNLVSELGDIIVAFETRMAG